MSLNSFDATLSRSPSYFDDRRHLRSNGARVARFVMSSDDEEEECEDVVVQLPVRMPPPAPQQRSRSFPHRWNPTAGGGLRRAVGRLSATGRLLGRRSVPSASSSWNGRRALEQALLFAAAVPLRASSETDSAPANSTSTTVDPGSEQALPRWDSSTEVMISTDIMNDPPQSDLTLNSEVLAGNNSVFTP